MLFLKIESGWGESLIIGMHKKQVNKERRGYENIIKCILMDLSKNMLYDSILNTFKVFFPDKLIFHLNLLTFISAKQNVRIKIL